MLANRLHTVMFWAMIGMPIWLLGAGALLARATSVSLVRSPISRLSSVLLQHLSQREEQEMQARLPSAMVGQDVDAAKEQQ